MRILIFEDEIPAYEKLLNYISNAMPEATVLGWGRSTSEVEHFLSKHEDVDLIFSDIKLLDGLSFDVFEKIEVRCPIIFCTAFDEFLFQAFKTNGIAYLLKPYSEENFTEALEKYQSLFGKSQKSIDQDVISELKNILQEEQKSYKQRFSIKKATGIKLLPVDNIVLFQASGDFSFAYDSDGEKHIVNYSVGDIESRVDPKTFFRINRSEILSIDYIEKIESYFKNRLAIKITGLEELRHTSSGKTKDFRKWLDET
jgi:two-component system, LytTR family, response regulator LytT